MFIAYHVTAVCILCPPVGYLQPPEPVLPLAQAGTMAQIDLSSIDVPYSINQTIN